MLAKAMKNSVDGAAELPGEGSSVGGSDILIHGFRRQLCIEFLGCLAHPVSLISYGAWLPMKSLFLPSDKNSSNLRTRVGKYELGRTLGAGNFAKVKHARHLETGKQFAIKILEKEKILKVKMAEQIKREISTMKLVKHPNIVELHEVMASKTRIYFVLEYVTGGELFNKIAREGKLKEDEARKYFQQLINAVDYCHSWGVYHRDLKPENLLLDSRGNLKISDFGFSALPQQLRVHYAS
ncbi:hypothetical protein L7F22_041302 [Adiantum nelumboides]|nr:hypothetical protein [Adiantum nelumboides]